MARHSSSDPVLGALALLCLLAGPAAAEPLAVEEIAPGNFVHRGAHAEAGPENLGDIANLGFIVGETAVAVIDSGGSAAIGRRLLEAVRKVTDLPVRYLINTHVHPDHLFGNAVFRDAGAEIVDHANLPRALAARGAFYREALGETLGEAAAGSEVVAPSLTVADSLSLDLGGRRLQLTAHPAAHTDADLTVYDEATGTLWLGDLLFVERVPVIDGSLNGWLAVMEQLRGQPARRAVPGHGPSSVAWPGALAAQEAYLSGLRDGLRKIIAVGGTIEQALADPRWRGEAARWRLFEAYHKRNVVTAFTELEWE